MRVNQKVETMDSLLSKRRYQGHRMATAPEISATPIQLPPFRHATDPTALNRTIYEPSPAAEIPTSRNQTNDDFEVDLSSRPRSGAASPHRHSFDSDLRNYFLRERRHSHLSDGGDHEPRADSGLSIFEFALHRYGVTLIPIVPQKEKEKLSLSKLFGGSYKRKPSISGANNPQHVRHVEYDAQTGQFLGLPKDWEQHLTSGSSGDRWGALINNPIPHSHSDSTASLEERTSFERADDSKRSTLSSTTTETFYSDNSRYRQPADRPASFISTTASTNDDFAVDHEEPREVDSHPYSRTPRPLPHTPLL